MFASLSETLWPRSKLRALRANWILIVLQIQVLLMREPALMAFRVSRSRWQSIGRYRTSVKEQQASQIGSIDPTASAAPISNLQSLQDGPTCADQAIVCPMSERGAIEVAMIFHETSLVDAKLIDLTKRGDERGFFARTFCEKEFAAQGLETRFVQQNASSSAQKGTLRGMHFQRGDDAEVKLIRCLRGAILDVIIDIRPQSPTFKKWEGFELNDKTHQMLYVPRGFAHGFITLTDDVEVTYLVSAFYAPSAEGGVRWDDPAFAIDWPMVPKVMTDKDRTWPDFLG
jgi:dTDP-4-dehydrorhamnose 3,5-epimerase